MVGWFGSVMSLMLLAGSVPVSAPAKAEKQVFYAGYGFEPGETNRFKLEFNQEMEIRGSSRISLIDMEITEKCVEALDDTLFKMEVTIDKLEASFRRNDNLLDNDIGDDISGQTFTFDLTPKGDTRNLEPKGFIENEKKVVGLLEQMLRIAYPELPDSDVAVGTEWKLEGVRSGGAESEMETEYEATYIAEGEKKIKGRKCYKIKIKIDAYVHGRMTNDNAEVIIDGTGKGEAEMYFDAEGKKVMKLKSRMELDLTAIDASRSAAAEREAQEVGIVYTLKKEIK
jgi:hypothetical protein